MKKFRRGVTRITRITIAGHAGARLERGSTRTTSATIVGHAGGAL